MLPLAWLDPQRFVLAIAYPVTLQAILAGVLFGLFARLNDACAFGTLAHLTGGRLDYVLSVVGMVVGGVLGDRILPNDAIGDASPVAAPTLLGLAALSICAVLASPAFKARHIGNLQASVIDGKALLRPMTAMLVIGITGGLLYVSAGDWTYLSILHREAYPTTESGGGELTSGLGVFAIVGGGVVAALRSGRFKINLPTYRKASRCLIGGLGMGVAAAAIPGGNASMLVFAVPSFAPHAIAAYAAMTAALALSFVPARRVNLHSRSE